MRNAKFILLALLVALALSACAAGSSPADGDSELTGSVVAYLAGVPESVLCVTLSASTTGGTFSASQAVTDTAKDVEIALGPLPFGAATVSASAFPSACGTAGAVATWRSDPLAVTINASNVTDLDLVLRPYAATGVDVSFKPLVTDFAVGEMETLVAFHDHGVASMGNTYYINELGLRTDVTRVFAGQQVFCETTTSGALYCAGNNTDGALGIGSASNSVFLTPQLVATITNATKVSLQYHHGCSVGTGDLYCWGDNSFGQITTGTTDQRTPLYIGNAYRDVAVGRDYTCWLSQAGYVSCRGANTGGQLGNGTMTGATGVVSSNILSGVTQLAAGEGTTYALMADGTVKAWGANGYGSVGNGASGGYVVTPTTVSGLSNVVQISASWASACALLGNGDVYCWGEGDIGQVGNGKTAATQATAVKVLSGAKRLANSAVSAMCAQLTAGDLMCWGYNAYGNLGDGTNNALFVPTLVTNW